MLTDKKRQVFESVARGTPQLREYLREQLERKFNELVMTVDGEQIRRTQGYAQCLQNLIAEIDAALAPKAPASPAPRGASST